MLQRCCKIIGGKLAMCYNAVVVLQRQTRKANSANTIKFMGAVNDMKLFSATDPRRNQTTPKSLALILGLKVNTLYKAWKANNLNGWAIGEALDQADIDAIVLYYAGLGNETALKLAEGAQERMEKQAESDGNAVSAPLTDAETLTEITEGKRKSAPSRWYYIADLILLFVLGVSGYELHFFLGKWGLFFWGVYAAAVILSLIMAKDKSIPETAKAGFTAVCILETLAFFGHFAMANLLVVNAAKANLLPFRYEAWGTLSAPFYIAAVLAAILSGIVIYVVWIRLSITKELNKKDTEQ